MTQPPGLASLNSGTGTVQYYTVGSVRFNLREEVSPPYLFPCRCTYSMPSSMGDGKGMARVGDRGGVKGMRMERGGRGMMIGRRVGGG